MTFTNNRLDLFDGESYGEIQHANAFAKGLPNFVVQGLELTGTTLTSGIFVNTGTFGQLGTAIETHTIATNYTGYVVIKSTLSGRTSTSVIELSTTYKETDPRTASNVRYFTIYELSNGSIIKDFRHIGYVKEFRVEKVDDNTFRFVLNGFPSDTFQFPETGVYSVNNIFPDGAGNIQLTAGDVGALSNAPKEILDGEDLNTYQKIGFYHNRQSANVILNVPVPNIAFSLFVEQTTTDGWKQTWTSYHQSTPVTMYIRTSHNEDWGSWYKVLMEAGGEERTVIGDGTGTNGGAGNSIVLNESIWNFANVSISTIQETDTVNVIHKKIPVSDLTARQSSTTAYRNGSTGDSVYFSNFVAYSDVTGLNLNPSTSGLFLSYSRVADDGTAIRFTDGCGVLEIYGHNRIYPEGTTHSVEMIDNKLFKVVTMPNNEKIIKNLTSSIEKKFSVLVG